MDGLLYSSANTPHSPSPARKADSVSGATAVIAVAGAPFTKLKQRKV